MTRAPRTATALRRTTAVLAVTILAVMALAISALWSVPAHAGPIPVPPVPTPSQQPEVPSPITHLTPAETRMCLRDPGTCVSAVASRDFAFANDNNVAGIPEKNQRENDKVDAARHCLWQLSLSTWFGTGYAEQWGDVHEQNDDPAYTHAMDLHNNIVARAMAADPTLTKLHDQANADMLPPDPAGNPPEMDPSAKDAVNQQIIKLCTAAVGQAVLVTYRPQTGRPLADQLTPDPQDRLVYLPAKP